MLQALPTSPDDCSSLSGSNYTHVQSVSPITPQFGSPFSPTAPDTSPSTATNQFVVGLIGAPESLFNPYIQSARSASIETIVTPTSADVPNSMKHFLDNSEQDDDRKRPRSEASFDFLENGSGAAPSAPEVEGGEDEVDEDGFRPVQQCVDAIFDVERHDASGQWCKICKQVVFSRSPFFSLFINIPIQCQIYDRTCARTSTAFYPCNL